MDPALALALTLQTADYLQTRDIVAEPHQCEALAVVNVKKQTTVWTTCVERSEQNPLMGRHPSQARVAAMFAAGAGATIFLNQVLPEPWRSRHIYTVIGFEAAIVSHNAYMGVHFHF